MGTEKESRKIQDVINKANVVWNNDHKENQKNIFMRNIIKYPLNYFFFNSILYLCPVFLYVFLQWMSSVDGGDLSGIYWIKRVIEILFNIPYYLFDIRLGVITSIASLLLSLYVSVGKYADGLGGVTNDARRVVYRRFARWVGIIIFLVYVVNFWHGLLAGYFQGGLSISYPFKYWVEAPVWGRDIVPGDINLSRYGEMPLWVLLFFAWFTLASSFMLTYSEKDALIRNLFVLDGINRLRGREGESLAGEYILAQAAYNLDKDSGVTALGKYGRKLLPVYDYIGFKFDASTDSSSKNRLDRLKGWVESFVDYLGDNSGAVKRWHILTFVAYLSLVFLPIMWVCISLFLRGGGNIFSWLYFVAVGTMVVYVVVLIRKSRFIPYFIVLVYVFQNLKVEGWRATLKNYITESINYLKLCSSSSFNVFLIALMPTALVCLSVTLYCKNDGCAFLASLDDSVSLLCYIIFVYGLPFSYMFLVQKPILEDKIVKYSQDSLGELIERMRENNSGEVDGLNYLAVAYIYCLMRDVDELYSEYEIEAGLAKRSYLEDTEEKSYYPTYPLKIKYKELS